MIKPVLLTAAVLSYASSALLAQQVIPRRADIRAGDPTRGKCTAEIVVDGAAEVEVRGDTAYLRTLNGQPAQWRRFECSAPIPNNPAEFRFAGVDGRGRQELVREPGQGNGPVVRIEDPESGAEAYTFDLFWRAGSIEPQQNGRYNGSQTAPYGGQPRVYTRENANQGYPSAPGGYPQGQARTEYPARGQNYPARNNYDGPEVGLCQDAVRRKAMMRFRVRDLGFQGTNVEGNSSRFSTVAGTFEDTRRGGSYRFTCSIDSERQRVRSATVTQMSQNETDRYSQRPAMNGVPPYGDRNTSGSGYGQVTDECQRAATDRLRRDGYSRADFRSLNAAADHQVTGVVEADGPNGRTALNVSCTIDPRDGRVRNVDIQARY